MLESLTYTTGAVFLASVLTGSFLAYTMLTIMSTSYSFSWVYTLLFSAGAIVGARWVGWNHLAPLSWNEFETVVMLSVFGAVLGITVIVLLFEPNTESSTEVAET